MYDERSLALARRQNHGGALLWGWLRFGFRRALAWILLWNERSVARRHLLELDDHMLKDIGISRAEVEKEGQKRFWEV